MSHVAHLSAALVGGDQRPAAALRDIVRSRVCGTRFRGRLAAIGRDGGSARRPTSGRAAVCVRCRTTRARRSVCGGRSQRRRNTRPRRAVGTIGPRWFFAARRTLTRRGRIVRAKRDTRTRAVLRVGRDVERFEFDVSCRVDAPAGRAALIGAPHIFSPATSRRCGHCRPRGCSANDSPPVAATMFCRFVLCRR